MEITEHKLKIPPSYQYSALRNGNIFQRQWHRNRLTLIDSLNFINKNDSLADMGCGSGNVVLRFCGKAKEIIGFDYNNESLNFLKSKLAEQKVLNADTCRADVLVGFPEKFNHFFSKVILNEVIEHFNLREVNAILKNIGKILGQDGEILITTPNCGVSAWGMMEYFVDIFGIFPKLWGEQHKIRFNRRTLSMICERQGFTVIRGGTFGHLSPFMAIFGVKIADFITKIEIKYCKFLGPQLFVIIKKTK